MARPYPDHPLPSCHALVRRGDQILLVQRARPPFEGHWALPGGGIELGETVEAALMREVREETGLSIRISRLLGHMSAIESDATDRIRYHYVILYFEAEATGGELRPDDDAAAAEWLTVAEARQRPLTDAVEQCIRWGGL